MRDGRTDAVQCLMRSPKEGHITVLTGIVREYVFTFFSKSKNATLYVFCQQNWLRVVTVVFGIYVITSTFLRFFKTQKAATFHVFLPRFVLFVELCWQDGGGVVSSLDQCGDTHTVVDSCLCCHCLFSLCSTCVIRSLAGHPSTSPEHTSSSWRATVGWRTRTICRGASQYQPTSPNTVRWFPTTSGYRSYYWDR